MAFEKLDEIDIKIISILQENPNTSHTRIAKMVDRSQPAVGSRIQKLRKQGLLKMEYGLDMARVDLSSAQVRFSTTDPVFVTKLVEVSPFIVSCLRVSGKRNYSIVVVAEDLPKLDRIIDLHFRNQESIKNLKVELITSLPKPFVVPIHVNIFADETAPEMQEFVPAMSQSKDVEEFIEVLEEISVF